MVVLDATIVNIAMPSAQHQLHISDANRQWIVTAYTLAFGGLLLLGGRIADYAGRKRVFLIGLLGFAGASALGGAAGNAVTLFAARGLQGLFGALLAPAALSLITVTFTDVRDRARAFGVFGAISGVGAAIGLIMGGLLTQYTSWRWCLLVNIPIALLAFFLALPIVKESRASGNTRYDVPGAVLATGGLTALVYGFTKAAEDGWSATVTLVLFAIAAALLVGFVVLEARSANPPYPSFILPAFIIMAVGMALIFVPLGNTSLTGVSPHDAGVASAMVNTTQQIGGSLGVALLNTVFTNAVASYLTAHGPAAAPL